MRSNIHFIINPISGTGKQRAIENILQKYPSENYTIHYTQRRTHAYEIASSLKEKGEVIIVAVGGDGTVNEIGKSILMSDATLGIIPCGSGNGLARSLRIPLNLEKAISVIFNGNKKKIDTGIINSHPFMGVAGIGFDAHVAWEFALTNKRGFKTYINVVRKQISAYKPVLYDLDIDGNMAATDAMLITIANSQQWGNNAIIAPRAKLDDGLLEIAVLKPFPIYNVLSIAYNLFSGRLKQSKYVNYYSGKTIRITSKAFCDEIRIHVDGEPIACNHEINIQINPLSLNVIIP